MSVTADLLGTTYLLVPLLGGALAHGLCVRFDWLPFLAHPIDGVRFIGGRRVFGENKTFRGPAALAAGTSLLMGIQTDLLHDVAALRALELIDYSRINGWLVGACVGAAAMLAELPNSFLKRRLGVPPGQSAGGVKGWLLYAVDQVDLLAGVWLVVVVVIPSIVTPRRLLLSLGIVFVVHQLTNIIGYTLGMRASRR